MTATKVMEVSQGRELSYVDLATRFEGGSGAAGSGRASCAYDPMGNPLAMTDPRGFTTRYDRNELGEAHRTISPQPYNFRVETYYLCPCQHAGAEFFGPICRRASQGTGRWSFSHSSIAA